MGVMFGREEESVTRTEETVVQYRKHVLTLFRISGLGLNFTDKNLRTVECVIRVVGWFVDQHCRWSASTIRAYRAALVEVVRANVSGNADKFRILAVLEQPIVPRQAINRATASGKRKSVATEEVKRVIEALDLLREVDVLIVGFLTVGPKLALRPSEYLHAKISGRCLDVRNSKATNGRANGLVRHLDLSALSSVEFDAVSGFISRFKRATLKFRTTKCMLNCLASRLARVCKKLKIRRISLYTMRHVGLASAKRKMTVTEVAALAGHVSCVTATRHYAKSRTGRVGIRMARPTLSSIEAVHDDVHRTSRQLKMDQRRIAFSP